MTVIAGETVATFVVLSNAMPAVVALAADAALPASATTAGIAAGAPISGES